ncbi:MAG: hypothetical protein ACK5RL_05160, partial [Acidimicrobiales bacterium]
MHEASRWRPEPNRTTRSNPVNRVPAGPGPADRPSSGPRETGPAPAPGRPADPGGWDWDRPAPEVGPWTEPVGPWIDEVTHDWRGHAADRGVPEGAPFAPSAEDRAWSDPDDNPPADDGP